MSRVFHLHSRASLVAVIPAAVVYGLAAPVPLIAVEGIRRLMPSRVLKVAR